jgi:hypothetical protein
VIDPSFQDAVLRMCADLTSIPAQGLV